ncbi:MAG TPA: biotin/lipoyl-binding protein [Patescibacteria group bacterium]|nr:biotin/lipoyl-binding protein [Patescibacteria group bacterium]
MHRRLPLFRPVLTLGATLLIAVTVLLLFVRIDRVVVAHGHLAGGTMAVYAPWEGRVNKVFVTPGDRIEAGQPLVEMESAPLQAEEARIQARVENLTDRIETLRSEKDRLVSEVHPAEITQSSRDLERAHLELNSAEAHFNLTKQLWDMGLTTKFALQEAELALELGKVALKEAEAAAPILESKQHAQIEQMAAEIRFLAGQVVEEQAVQTELRRKLALDTLMADVDAIVLGNQLFELEGRTVSQGDELLRLSTGTAERFEGVLYDSGRASARPGLRVKIRLEGYPWLIHGTLSGHVDFVADRRDGDGGFPVKVSFDSSTAPGPLYDGMKGQARIVVEKKVSLGRLLIEKLVGTKEP